MFSNDFPYILQWWFTLFVIGVVSFPLLFLFFKNFFDAGYGLAKIFGLAIFSFTVFFLSIIQLLPLERPFIYLVLEIYIVLNLYLFIKNKSAIITAIKEKAKILVFQEVLFIFGLTLWSYVRGHSPDINGLEKFMDYGFINSILETKFLPPADMWFVGKPINYYWFGHFWAALTTKLSALPAAVTYNLLIATILGFSLTASFSIVSTLVSFLKEGKGTRLAFAAGLISAILLTFAGNFHTPYYVLKDGVEKYWYPDATRFIGYNPDTNDKTIHEFPMYSFVVSDLHAHLLNFPFVLLYIALLASTILAKDGIPKKNLLALGFVLGIMFMTSTWDFGNYSLVTGVAFLTANIRKHKISVKTIINTAVLLFMVLPIAFLTALPFILNFESIAQGIDLVKAHTPLWQLAILWGFPGVLTIIFSLISFKVKNLTKADVFVLSLLISSWILIFLPEVIYVKDIYVASHHRANTMFKLTYQAYVMTYLTSGYIAIRTFTVIRNTAVKLVAALFFLAVFASILPYAYFSTDSYYGKLKTYRGLNGESWLLNLYPNEQSVISWLRGLPGQPTILEAPGDSYTEFNVISSYSGLPTVSGWFVHEWLWRGTADIPQERVSEITLIYTSTDNALTKSLLTKYGVEYVIVGNNERTKFPGVNEVKFTQLGQLVYSTGVINVYKITQ